MAKNSHYGNQSTSKTNATVDASSAATKKNAASVAATQRREAQRKQLLELKRKHKNTADQKSIDISIIGAGGAIIGTEQLNS